MIAKIYSAIPIGYDSQIIEVETDLSRGIPCFNIVGMANKTINESKERVKSALLNSGFSFPPKHLTINLAPTETQKDGSHLDLAIAISILVSSNQLRIEDIKDNQIFIGELSLDGSLRPVRGIINLIEAAKTAGFSSVYLPKSNLARASLVKGIDLYGFSSISELFSHLKRQSLLSPYQPLNTKPSSNKIIYPTIDHIKGQNLAKRALIIAIAGHHNLLLSGSPGSGKSLLAKSAQNLLPPLSEQEQITATKLHSLTSVSEDPLTSRPFRSPHHTSSIVSIIGGGTNSKPGEISLAHAGILFLDELLEYPRSVLESLRQPLEDKTITISRANLKTTYPANFILLATTNPCPCGYLKDPNKPCSCTPREVLNYQKKLSGPLLDRIDLVVSVEKVKNSELLAQSNNPANPNTQTKALKDIKTALKRQSVRFSNNHTFNNSLTSYHIAKRTNLTPDATHFLTEASEKLNLSARSYFKTIKVARTIADLADQDLVDIPEIAEALSFRIQHD